MLRTGHIVLAMGTVVVVLAGWYYYAHMQPVASFAAVQRTVAVGNQTVRVDVVADDAARERGLSGRDGLTPNSGMLFVFDSDAQWGIWMKDMQFSIDILWLAQDGTVLAMVQNASPDSYPEVFRPQVSARYALELPAGFAAAHGISVGNKFVL